MKKFLYPFFGGVSMFCKYCGNQLDDDAVFCSKCGKQLNEKMNEVKTEEKTAKPVEKIEPVENEKIWMYRNKYGEAGPYTREEMAEKILSGNIDASCLIKKDTDSQWYNFHEYRNLFVSEPEYQASKMNRSVYNQVQSTDYDHDQPSGNKSHSEVDTSSIKIACIISCIAIGISILFPFVSVSALGMSVSFSMIDAKGIGDWIFVLIIAISGLFDSIQKKYVGSLITGLISFVFFIIENNNIVGNMETESGLVKAMLNNGLGYYLWMLGSIALCIFSIIGIIKRKAKNS